MMTVDAAFDRLGSTLRQRGYAFVKEDRSSEDRYAIFKSPDMSVRISWKGKARLMTLEVDAESGWAEFARRSFGPRGLEDTSVEALVRAIGSEVSETSTDSD
jgi:hypothetical protein